MSKQQYIIEAELLCTEDCYIQLDYTRCDNVIVRKGQIVEAFFDDLGVHLKFNNCYYPYRVSDMANHFVINHTTNIRTDNVAIYTKPIKTMQAKR